MQEMLVTCEPYAKEHNLQFSTDVIPSKSKTKCIAFVKDKREIKHMILCGNKLPWVDNIKHLGSLLTNDSDMMGSDTMQKRASYINRNNEFIQEFHFAHPISKVKINNSSNTSFYGCVLWDLFGKESLRLEKTWNVSMRKLLNLPRNAHRYLIEPISNTRHIISSLYSRFVRFIDKIISCNKSAILNLFHTIKHDCRSKTGSNLRKTMLRTGNDRVDDIRIKDINRIVYQDIPNGSDWRIEMVKEIGEYNFDHITLPGFDRCEMADMLNFVCTS